MESKKLIYGRNPVLEYIKKLQDSNRSMELYVSEKAHGKIIDEIKKTARSKGITTIGKDRAFFSKLGTSSVHQGVALDPGQALEKKIPSSLIETDKNNAAGSTVLILLDQITDPHNMGSIIRTAEALGAGGIIIPSDNSCEINATVIKASAGATAHIAIETITSVAQYLERAKKKGFWIIGMSDHGTSAMADIRNVKPALIIIGSEGKGMRRLTEDKCDFVVKIPLKGNVSSLNASVAAGIILHEVLK